ncbi:MAG: glutamate--tRNA ligase [Flavobacteriales bacterium Tduv]
MKKVRVRFAPSPTGPLHLGGVRTALYNYLFARKHQGDFLLRIEDTDRERFISGAEDYIIKALRWCGLNPDEGPGYGGDSGPYRQSERSEIYGPYVKQLLNSGHTYYAFDTIESLDRLRVRAQAKGQVFTYNARTRERLDNALNLSFKEVSDRLERGEPHVVRFKVPEGQTLEMNDIIRGKIAIDTHTLDDKVLVKSDGMLIYHLANIIDDHLMQISHVIRGEEWLPSMPLHLLLYRAFNWEAPKFAHLPLILKPEGKGKLSKRDGDRLDFPVFPLEWEDPQSGSVSAGYRESGYFPEAFINMLALLGWNPGGEQEIFSLEELAEKFSFEKVNKSGSRFSKEKAQWFNQQYLQCKPLEEISSLFRQELERRQIHSSYDYIRKVVEIIRERVHFVYEIWDQASYFFVPPDSYEEEAMKKVRCAETVILMDKVKDLLHAETDFMADPLRVMLQTFIEYRKLDFGQVMQPLRLSLVGRLHGADIFFIMETIGQKESLRRLERFCNGLNDRVMD